MIHKITRINLGIDLSESRETLRKFSESVIDKADKDILISIEKYDYWKRKILIDIVVFVFTYCVFMKVDFGLNILETLICIMSIITLVMNYKFLKMMQSKIMDDTFNLFELRLMQDSLQFLSYEEIYQMNRVDEIITYASNVYKLWLKDIQSITYNGKYLFIKNKDGKEDCLRPTLVRDGELDCITITQSGVFVGQQKLVRQINETKEVDITLEVNSADVVETSERMN
jgi:hypothetical protein